MLVTYIATGEKGTVVETSYDQTTHEFMFLVEITTETGQEYRTWQAMKCHWV